MRAAIRAARRMTVSFPGAPVTATRIRSAVSHTSPEAIGAPRAQELEQLLLGLVGHETQGQLAQRHQVLHPEEPRQRGVDLGCGIDVAVQHAAAQLVGRRVDQLELVGPTHHPVRDPFADGRRR